MYQKGVYCLGIKFCNSLPSDIKIFCNNPKNLKHPEIFYIDSFYSLEEYFNVKMQIINPLIRDSCVRFPSVF